MNYEMFMDIHLEFKRIFNLRLCLFYCSLMEGYVIELDDETCIMIMIPVGLLVPENQSGRAYAGCGESRLANAR